MWQKRYAGFTNDIRGSVHHGLLVALRDAGFDLEPREIESFMKANRISLERPWWRLRWRGLSRYLVGHQFVHGHLKGQFEEGDFEDD